MKPDAIVISPGPRTPKQAGISVDVVRKLHREIPILGVCLGHQSIGEAFGASVVKANRIFHGKTSEILHNGKDIFKNVPSPFTAARYHSLIVEKEPFPNELELTAWTDDGTVMGLKHKQYPTYGVQFHPESIATKHGKQIIKNFLSLR